MCFNFGGDKTNVLEFVHACPYDGEINTIESTRQPLHTVPEPVALRLVPNGTITMHQC